MSRDNQAVQYLLLAESDELLKSQARFKARWRDLISHDATWRVKIHPDYAPRRPSPADIAVRAEFNEAITGLSLDPSTTWREVNDAAAYVWLAKEEGSNSADLSSGFTQHDRQALAEAIVKLKAELRDKIAYGLPSRSVNPSDLGLCPARTSLQTRWAASYLSFYNIEDPSPITGFSPESHAPRPKPSGGSRASHRLAATGATGGKLCIVAFYDDEARGIVGAIFRAWDLLRSARPCPGDLSKIVGTIRKRFSFRSPCPRKRDSAP